MREQWRSSSQPPGQEPPAARQPEAIPGIDAAPEEISHEETACRECGRPYGHARELGEIATKGNQRMLEEEAVESGLGYAVYEPATEKTPEDTTPVLRAAGRFKGPGFTAIEGRARVDVIYINPRKSNRKKPKTRRRS